MTDESRAELEKLIELLNAKIVVHVSGNFALHDGDIDFATNRELNDERAAMHHKILVEALASIEKIIIRERTAAVIDFCRGRHRIHYRLDRTGEYIKAGTCINSSHEQVAELQAKLEEKK